MKTTPQNILFLINQNKANPEIRSLAVSIIKTGKIKATNYPKVIEAISDWVHNNIMFVRDPYQTDIMHTPLENIKMGFADCEDQTSLTATLLESLGIPTQVVIISKKGDIWDHVFLKAGYPPDNPRNWISVDTTITPPSGREISYAKKRIYENYGYGGLGSPEIVIPKKEIALMKLIPPNKRPILSYGSGFTEKWTEINSWVHHLQTFLFFLGYFTSIGEIDGKFGNHTEKAVKQFQREYNIYPLDSIVVDVDGVVETITWTAIDLAVNNKVREIEEGKEENEEEDKKEEEEGREIPKFLDNLYSFAKEHKWLSLGAVGIIGLGIYLGIRR